MSEIDQTYDYPVWGTQGGGLVRDICLNRYIFVTKPSCPGLDVGDFMPEEWSIAAANKLALEENDRQIHDMDMGFTEFFDALIEQRRQGKITQQQALEFFPKEVRERNK